MTDRAGLRDIEGRPIDPSTEMHRSRYPKWATLCLLRHLGLPTLGAVLVVPSQVDRLPQAADRLAAMLGTETLLLRSDGGIETASYYVGGGSHNLERLIPVATRLLSHGRAILLMEPTDRYTNRLTANLRIDQDSKDGPGSLTIEILGPGYDAGDLNRGGLLPEVTIDLPIRSWRTFEAPWPTDFRVTQDRDTESNERRRGLRLSRIGSILLPSTGELDHPGNAGDAEQWLRNSGNTYLWQPLSMSRVARRARRWYEEAFLIANGMPSSHWTTMSASMSLLGSREVWWDIVHGAKKYAAHTHRPTNGTRSPACA